MHFKRMRKPWYWLQLMLKVPAHMHIIGPSHRLNTGKCQNSAAINIWDIRRAKRLQRGLKRTAGGDWKFKNFATVQDLKSQGWTVQDWNPPKCSWISYSPLDFRNGNSRKHNLGKFIQSLTAEGQPNIELIKTSWHPSIFPTYQHQTWYLSKNLHRLIFGPKTLHTKSA